MLNYVLSFNTTIMLLRLIHNCLFYTFLGHRMLNCATKTKTGSSWGFAPEPTEEAYNAPSGPLVNWRGTPAMSPDI